MIAQLWANRNHKNMIGRIAADLDGKRSTILLPNYERQGVNTERNLPLIVVPKEISSKL